MPPQVPALRPAVQQNDQRAAAFDDSAQADAIRFNHLKIAFLHVVTPAGLSASNLPEQCFIEEDLTSRHLHYPRKDTPRFFLTSRLPLPVRASALFARKNARFESQTRLL